MLLFDQIDRYKTVVTPVWPFFLVALGGRRFAAARMSAGDRGSLALESRELSRDDDERGNNGKTLGLVKFGVLQKESVWELRGTVI